MTESADPQYVNRHMLGPHVVGQRVVVRRIVRGETGPSGGPALTDVLGVCTAWGATCVVVPEDGVPVEIALGDIVSGKPVPPRPSTRLRVEPREAQLRGLALFPDVETRPLGDWLLRHSPTATARRANSVLAFGPSGARGDVEQVVDFYRGTTGRAVAAVLVDSTEDEMLRSLGWAAESTEADTLFQVAGVARARRALAGVSDDGVELSEDGGLVTARLGDRAGGIAAYDRDWVGFRGIEVAPEHRRQGLGLVVMAALLEWGAEQGATTAYLQVLGDNAPAIALYERLGFTTHHTYRYLALP